MVAPYDYKALWRKAELFINRAFDALDDGAFDVAALWAACSLELLGKAALAKLNPLLIADPTDDGKSLLIAAGVSQDESGFKSIPAKAVFSRCARAFPPFNAIEAGRIAVSRNEELHSGALPFTDLPEDLWWQRFWAQAVLLVQAQDETLESFAGGSRVSVVEGHLAKNAENVRFRVESMIQRAVQRYELLSTSKLTTKVAAELAATTSVGLEYMTIAECPACRERGFLYGDYVAESEVEHDYEEGVAWEHLSVYAEVFTCDRCGLLLEGPEFVQAAGLPEAFELEREAEPVWDDYGND